MFAELLGLILASGFAMHEGQHQHAHTHARAHAHAQDGGSRKARRVGGASAAGAAAASPAMSDLGDFVWADASDAALLELARVEASRLYQDDPELRAQKHRLLSDEAARFWSQRDVTPGEA